MARTKGSVQGKVYKPDARVSSKTIPVPEKSKGQTVSAKGNSLAKKPPDNAAARGSKAQKRGGEPGGLRNPMLTIPAEPFRRMIKRLAHRVDPEIKIASQALAAIQEATEMYMIRLFEDGTNCAIHSKRVTLMPKDLADTRNLHRIRIFYMKRLSHNLLTLCSE